MLPTFVLLSAGFGLAIRKERLLQPKLQVLQNTPASMRRIGCLACILEALYWIDPNSFLGIWSYEFCWALEGLASETLLAGGMVATYQSVSVAAKILNRPPPLALKHVLSAAGVVGFVNAVIVGSVVCSALCALRSERHQIAHRFCA